MSTLPSSAPDVAFLSSGTCQEHQQWASMELGPNTSTMDRNLEFVGLRWKHDSARVVRKHEGNGRVVAHMACNWHRLRLCLCTLIKASSITVTESIATTPIVRIFSSVLRNQTRARATRVKHVDNHTNPIR